MSNVAELHMIKQRVSEIEKTVGLLDRAQTRREEKLRDRLACAFAAAGYNPDVVYIKADEALKVRDTRIGISSLKEQKEKLKMKVKISDNIYSDEKEPVMVVLSD